MTTYAPFTSTAAVKRAKSWVGEAGYSNMCQAFVLHIFGTRSVGDFDGDHHADAQDGWKKARANGKVVLAKDIKSLNDIPAGVQLFWEGGSHGFGHTAVSVGGGNMVSTDAGKAWGYVGIRDIGYVSRVWRNGLTFRGYATVDGNGTTLTDKPKALPAPYKKPKASGELFRVGTYNLALYNKRGESTFVARRSKVVANIKSANLDVLCVQEAGFDQLKFWDAEFLAQGLARAKGGSDGRYIYYRKSIFTVQASGVFQLHPEFQNDDKQAAWAVLVKDGVEFFFSSLHLESDPGAKPDAIRPAQMESVYAQAAPICTRRGIGLNRRFFVGDTNSEGLVKDQMWKVHQFVPASKNAAKTFNYAYATFQGWVSKLKGAHVDYIFIHQSRPVLRWRQVLSTASDHNLTYAVIGRV